MYLDPIVNHYHARHSFTRKFCGCMALRGGCAMVCTFWAGLHLYIAVMAFQLTNPVFSYLNRIAMNVLGAVCVLFVLISFYNLISLFLESFLLLRVAHRITWVVVVMFLVCYFICIILFGVQNQDFIDWCVTSADNDPARQEQQLDRSNPDLAKVYNCQRLWEGELKLSIAVFIILTICYLYWATCLWSYAQKIYTVGKQADRALARGPPLAPPPAPMMPPPPGTVHHPPIPSMMNLKPKIMVLDDGSTKYEMSPEDSSITIQQYNEKEQRGYQHTHQQEYDDAQKSAAQIARIFFKKLKHVYKNNRR